MHSFIISIELKRVTIINGFEGNCLVYTIKLVLSLLHMAVFPFDNDFMFLERKGALKFNISISDFIQTIFLTKFFFLAIIFFETQRSL